MLKYALFVVVSLVALSPVSSKAAAVTASAEVSSGLSYQKDPQLAASDPIISANPAFMAAVANGDDLLIGNTVLIGSFNIDDATIAANSGNVQFLTDPTNFSLFGSMHIGDGSAPVGSFANTVTNNSLSFVGKQIYMFVIAGTDNSTVQTSIDTAFQIGIFYQASDSWIFPNIILPPTTTTIDLADLTQNQDGLVLDANAHVVVGSFGPDTSNNIPSALDFSLASVPEPTSGALLGLVGAGILARRRRTKRVA